jgi:cytochrome o ubiquinol oxidase operon protein cyoD
MHDKSRASLQTYVVGFILSIGLTLWAYVSVVYHSFNGHVLLAWLMGLALVQFIVQIIFFLHIGSETKPRWRRLMLVLMIFFALVVVMGSIWIMYNLNYRMSPQQMNQYMSQQAGEGF